MLFYIYCRKSVYTAHGESIQNQKEMCTSYIENKFGKQCGDIIIYEDEGFSGKNTKRPMFQKMLSDIKSKQKPDYIICYRLDRISRNVSDFSALIENLNTLKISLICIKEEFDTSKPVGKAMMYIASVFAQLERETIAERVKDNMQMLAKSGCWLGGSTPFGFVATRKKVNVDGKIKDISRLKAVNSEINTVRFIFEQYKEHKSFSAVCKLLSENGIKTRNENDFSPTYIKQILTNPVYCVSDNPAVDYFKKTCNETFAEIDDRHGIIAYNKRESRLCGSPRREIDKWIIATGRHSGIIDGEEWVCVQKIINENIIDGKKFAVTHNKNAILSGYVSCGICNNKMFAKQRQNSDKYDYICATKQKYGVSKCCSQNLDGAHTDKTVLNEISAFLCNDFSCSTNTLNNIQKQELIKKICAKIEWDGKDIHIFFN